jgi:hypothetical protein
LLKSYEVLDLNGRVIRRGEFGSPAFEQTIDLIGLEAGLYVLRMVRAGSTAASIKLVKSDFK